MRRSRQEQRDAGPTRDAGLTAGPIRFRRRVHMQDNRPRACRLGAVGVGAEQKRRTGDVIRRSGPAGSYASVPAVSQRHTRVSSGGLACEQENPEVCGEVGVANQSGSIVSSQGSTTSNSSYPSLIAQPITVTTGHREKHLSGHLPPTTIPGQASSSFPYRNLIIIEHFSSPILFVMRIHFPIVLLHNQSYPKVCPDPLNLPNAGDSPCRNIIVIFLFFVFPDQGLNFFDL
jgi:hypothetical protein